MSIFVHSCPVDRHSNWLIVIFALGKAYFDKERIPLEVLKK